MAKSKGFFGLRSGSAGNFTYSVGRDSSNNKQQITRERVTEVANPRTPKQQQRRLLFSTIASLVRIYSPVLDNSSQGDEFGRYNKQLAFSRSIALYSRNLQPSVPYLYAEQLPDGTWQRLPDSVQTPLAPMVLSSGTLRSLPAPSFQEPVVTDEVVQPGQAYVGATFDLGVSLEAFAALTAAEKSASVLSLIRNYFRSEGNLYLTTVTAVQNANETPFEGHRKQALRFELSESTLSFVANAESSAFTAVVPAEVLVDVNVGDDPQANYLAPVTTVEVVVSGASGSPAVFIQVTMKAADDTGSDLTNAARNQEMLAAGLIVSDSNNLRSDARLYLNTEASDIDYYQQAIAQHWPTGDAAVLSGGEV